VAASAITGGTAPQAAMDRAGRGSRAVLDASGVEAV